MGNCKELGYARSKTLPEECADCRKTDRCLLDIITAKDAKDVLLAKYLTNSIDLECIATSTTPCTFDALAVAKKIADALVSTDLNSIISILKSAERTEAISADNIPQFGDLSIAMYLIPNILAQNAPIGYVECGKKIFYKGEKKDGAYRKYAENHCKLAALMDLAVIKGHRPHGVLVSSSVMGRYFVSLTDEEKDALLPRLCIRIPIVQEALISDDRQASILGNLSILSQSTIIRRKTGIFDLVSFALGE